MWVAFPLSPLPPVHPRVKEIQSREPKVAEHEVERKRERKEEQKKNKERENSFGKRRGFPRLHLSHLVKRPESVFLSPPPFFPTYLAHCRRLMAGFQTFFGGQQRRPALCYSFSPSSSFPPFRWCKWHQSFQANGDSPRLIFAFASLNWQELLFCIYMHSSCRFTTYVRGALKYKKILQKRQILRLTLCRGKRRGGVGWPLVQWGHAGREKSLPPPFFSSPLAVVQK